MVGASDIREQTPGALVKTQDATTHQRSFKVFARSENEAILKLQLYRNIFINAAWFTTYGEKPDASVVCRKIATDPGSSVPASLGGQGDYMVVCDYEKPERDEAVVGGPPVYRGRTSLQSAPIDVDADGDPIVNMVDEPIAASDFEDREVFNIEWWTKYESLANFFSTVRPYRNSLNLVNWQGLDRGWARLRGVDNVEEVYVEDGVWVKQQTSVEVRTGIDTSTFGSQIIDKSGATVTGILEGWAQVKLHQGTREKGAVVNDVQEWNDILTEDGDSIVTEPVLLGANGLRLPAADDPIYIMFNVVPNYRDLSALGI